MSNNNEDEERAKLIMDLVNAVTESDTENEQAETNTIQNQDQRRNLMQTCFNLFNLETENSISNLNGTQLTTVCILLGIPSTERNFLKIKEDLKLILRQRLNPTQNVTNEENSTGAVAIEENRIGSVRQTFQETSIQTYYADYVPLTSKRYNFLDYFEEDGIIEAVMNKISQSKDIAVETGAKSSKGVFYTLVGKCIQELFLYVLGSAGFVGAAITAGGTIVIVYGGTMAVLPVYNTCKSLYQKGFHETYKDARLSLDEVAEKINGFLKDKWVIGKLHKEIPVVRRDEKYKLLLKKKYVEIVRKPLLFFIENLNLTNFMFLFENLIKQAETSKELEIKREFKLDLSNVIVTRGARLFSERELPLVENATILGLSTVSTVSPGVLTVALFRMWLASGPSERLKAINSPTIRKNTTHIEIDKDNEKTYKSIIEHFNELINFIRAIDEDLRCYKYNEEVKPTYPDEYSPELTHKEKENVRNNFRMLCSSSTGKGLKIIQKFAEKNKLEEFSNDDMEKERDNLRKKLEERELRI